MARAIRERNRQMPLAVITGWGEAVGSNMQREAGIDWVVAKPFTVEQIVNMAREVSGRREGKKNNVASFVAA